MTYGRRVPLSWFHLRGDIKLSWYVAFGSTVSYLLLRPLGGGEADDPFDLGGVYLVLLRILRALLVDPLRGY